LGGINLPGNKSRSEQKEKLHCHSVRPESARMNNGVGKVAKTNKSELERAESTNGKGSKAMIKVHNTVVRLSVKRGEMHFACKAGC